MFYKLLGIFQGVWIHFMNVREPYNSKWYSGDLINEISETVSFQKVRAYKWTYCSSFKKKLYD
jgi:hypothetical protein